MASPQPQTQPIAKRRAFYAITSVVVVLVVGTVGFHVIEGMDYVDAFYFESMLATGQGPPLTLTTDAGKIFASIMAFISVASVITTLVFTFGPILAQIWRESLERVEVKARSLEREAKSIEGDLLERKHRDEAQ